MIGLIAAGVGLLATSVASALPKVKEEWEEDRISPTGNLREAGKTTGLFAGFDRETRTNITYRDSVGAKIASGIGQVAQLSSSIVGEAMGGTEPISNNAWIDNNVDDINANAGNNSNLYSGTQTT
jgi:hypothetical protein